MNITLLCNAGLSIAWGEDTLLVDIPNETFSPFSGLPEEEWQRILSRQPPYDRVCGLYFTHEHPDHCHREKADAYRQAWPDIPIFFPQEHPEYGTVILGSFVVSYERIDHAPMDVPTPPHVVTWIRAGEKSLYLAADAKLDVQAHVSFLKGRRAHAAFWNSMYLSRPETRELLRQAAERNYIYHMPPDRPDAFGLWSKCQKNLQRYGSELQTVTILERYPTTIHI